MNNVDRGLTVLLTLSIIIVGFVLEHKLILMHNDHLSTHSSTPGPSSSKYRELARLQRIEKGISVILTQRNCSAYVNLKNVADVLVSKLSRMLNLGASHKPTFGVYENIITKIDEDMEESKNQDLDNSKTLNSWKGLLIYRLLLAYVLSVVGFHGLSSAFMDKDVKGCCQIAVFLVVSCVGYFPNILMDVFSSHRTALYFRLFIGISRLLWIMAVCCVNTFIDKNSNNKTDYVMCSTVSIITMYNGIYPTISMFSLV